MTEGRFEVTRHLSSQFVLSLLLQCFALNSNNNRLFQGHLSALLSHKTNYVLRGILFLYHLYGH